MAWLGTLLAPFLERILDWGLAKIFQLSAWAVKKVQKRARISSKNSAVAKEIEALKQEILKAQEDGELTDEEIQRIKDRARLPNSGI